MKYLLFLLIGLFSYQFSFGQKKVVDSLSKLCLQYETQKNFEKDTSYLKTLNEYAFVYRTVNQDSTLIWATKCEKYAKAINYPKAQIEAMRIIGVYHYLKSDYPKAMQYFEVALKMAEKENILPNIARIITNIGNINEAEGDYGNALKNKLAVLKIREKLNDKKEIGIAMNNLGEIYRVNNKYKEALKYYEGAFVIFKEIKFQQGLSAILNNKAEILKEEGKYEEAFLNYKASLEITESTDKRRKSYRLNNMGWVSIKLNKQEDAKKYFYQALEMATAIDEKFIWSEILEGLGECFYTEKNYAKALKYAQEGLNLAISIGHKEKIRTGHEILSRINKAMKNYDKALFHHEQFKLYYDSLSNKDLERKTATLQAQYEFDKKEEDLKAAQMVKDLEHQKDIERQKYLTYSFVIGFAFMLLIAFLIFRSRQKEKKTNILLALQNAAINQQKEEITLNLQTVEKQNTYIEKQHKDITASINVGKRIQDAILPMSEEMQAKIANFFIFYQPRDIVSGDFYWFFEVSRSFTSGNFHQIFVVGDCTGHGVPGAFMSMIGNNLLNDIVKVRQIVSPDLILNELRLGVHKALQQDKTGRKEGMDIVILAVEKNRRDKRFLFAGAMNPLFYVKNNEFCEIKGDKMAIGGTINEKLYQLHEIHATHEEEITFWLTTDGYQDQFGGKENKKFMVKRLKNLLFENVNLSLAEQKVLLQNTFEDWKGEDEQIDDVTILGLRF